MFVSRENTMKMISSWLLVSLREGRVVSMGGLCAAGWRMNFPEERIIKNPILSLAAACCRHNRSQPVGLANETMNINEMLFYLELCYFGLLRERAKATCEGCADEGGSIMSRQPTPSGTRQAWNTTTQKKEEKKGGKGIKSRWAAFVCGSTCQSMRKSVRNEWSSDDVSTQVFMKVEGPVPVLSFASFNSPNAASCLAIRRCTSFS